MSNTPAYELRTLALLLPKPLEADSEDAAIACACAAATTRGQPLVLLRAGKPVGVAYANCPIRGRQFSRDTPAVTQRLFSLSPTE